MPKCALLVIVKIWTTLICVNLNNSISVNNFLYGSSLVILINVGKLLLSGCPGLQQGQGSDIGIGRRSYLTSSLVLTFLPFLLMCTQGVGKVGGWGVSELV